MTRKLKNILNSMSNNVLANLRSNEKKQIAKGYIFPDENDLIFYNYKEPLKKFDKGYGYYGVVLYHKDTDKVQCHFCGKVFRHVGIHAKFKHNLSAREYKEQVGLNYSTALVGEGTRQALIEMHKDIKVFGIKNDKKTLTAHAIKMSKIAKRKGVLGKHGWSLEKKNINGTCPDQLLDKIKQMYHENNEVPSIKEFRAKHTRYTSCIITTFGSWEKALSLCDFLYTNEHRDIVI